MASSQQNALKNSHAQFALRATLELALIVLQQEKRVAQLERGLSAMGAKKSGASSLQIDLKQLHYGLKIIGELLPLLRKHLPKIAALASAVYWWVWPLVQRALSWVGAL